MDVKGYILSNEDYQIWQDMKAQFLGGHKQHGGNLPTTPDFTIDREELWKFKITSAISSQGGRYNAKLILDAGVNAAASGNLATTDVGTLSSSENIIVWNYAEIATSGHSISLSSDAACIQSGYVIGYDTASGKPIIGINYNGSFIAKITAVSGSFPTWTYTVQRVLSYDTTQTGAARWVTDGVNITGVLNRCEFSGTPNYTYGTGNNITASDGTINAGSCKIIPIGVGNVVDITGIPNNSSTITLSFSQASSGQ
jgi:hypothetical protein